MRPVVTDPDQNVSHSIHKKVGIQKCNAYCDIIASKNFYVAGEMAYLQVKIDNSETTQDCHLIIKHKHKLRIMLPDLKEEQEFENKSEKFFLASAG